MKIFQIFFISLEGLIFYMEQEICIVSAKYWIKKMEEKSALLLKELQ